ncbi:hypothetical protein [Limnoglobus roseus]|uniref:Uncharacterized protein n=1 Tax=Limnoglobus roseus TaxID=2598579 RepID=A0A5C1AL84_9BACT|nr:hypothetical protein [Limnoglobus roseus]QEL18913.1 hypothetical protein PX52LOC_05963 [Limnoglobus roseus]
MTRRRFSLAIPVALLAGVVYLLGTTAAEYRWYADQLDRSARHRDDLDSQLDDVPYQHAARGVLHHRPRTSPAAGTRSDGSETLLTERNPVDRAQAKDS